MCVFCSYEPYSAEEFKTAESLMEGGMKKAVFIFTLMVPVQLAFGNGGPIETSPVFGAGEGGPDLYVHRDVVLVSEELVFTPGISFVEVDVSYVLYNSGENLETGYCFPVTALNTPDENSYTENFNPEYDVQNFTITLNGVELPVELFLSGERESVAIPYGYSAEVSTHLYTTDLEIASGDTAVVQVSYSLRATYEDFQTTKNFFPSYEDRMFTYDLAPASWWGDGAAGSFFMVIDAGPLHTVGGTMLEVPDGGEWVQDDIYEIRAGSYQLESASPMYFSYESRLASAGDYLEEYTISPENYTVTTSSSLGSEYSTANLTDGDLSTAWSEGADGTGDQWILIEFDRSVSISWVGIAPGYMKSEYTYYANARPQGIDVEITYQERTYPETWDSDVAEISWETIQEGFTVDIYREVFNRGEWYPVKSLKIIFRENIPGEEFEDLCVSEIIVAGWNSLE